MKRMIFIIMLWSLILFDNSYATAPSIFESKEYLELSKESNYLMTSVDGRPYLILQKDGFKVLNLKSSKINDYDRNNDYATIKNKKATELMIQMVKSAKKNKDFVVPYWSEDTKEFEIIYFDDKVDTPHQGSDIAKFSIRFITNAKQYIALVDVKNKESFKYSLRVGPLWRESTLDKYGFDYIKNKKFLDSSLTEALKNSLKVIYPKSNNEIYKYVLDQYAWKYAHIDKQNYKLNQVKSIRIQNLIDEFNFVYMYLEGEK